MRLLLVLASLACGCSPTNQSFIAAKGALGDGTPFDVHFAAVVADSGTPWKLQTAAGSIGPGDLRGFWLWFDPSVTQGQTLASTGSSMTAGPLHFFVLRPLPDASAEDLAASIVDGGSVTFTAGGPDNYAGTLAKLSLVRSGQNLLTVDSGSFLAARR